jgi:hypothetical protein
MSADEKRTPKMVLVKVKIRWRRAGEVKAAVSSGGQGISYVRMPMTVRGPGLYRISIDLSKGRRAIYIGEGESVSRRLSAYTGIYNQGGRTKTEARVSREIRKALTEGRAVVIDTATTGRMNLTGAERTLQMDKIAERRFAEAAAALAELEQDVDGRVIFLNRILGEDWWLPE